MPPLDGEISDEQLMLNFQKGDKSAFEVLFMRHQRGVYNFIYRYIGRRGNVDEAFQEVFERIIRSSVSYTPQAKFSTWLYTIARNFCIDFFRKDRVVRRVTVDNPPSNGEDDDFKWEDHVADDEFKPDDNTVNKNLAEKIDWALDQINPDQKEVFILRERQDLPFEEIAQIVGISVNTVKSRMRYALQALKEEFKKIGILDPY